MKSEIERSEFKVRQRLFCLFPLCGARSRASIPFDSWSAGQMAEKFHLPIFFSCKTLSDRVRGSEQLIPTPLSLSLITCSKLLEGWDPLSKNLRVCSCSFRSCDKRASFAAAAAWRAADPGIRDGYPEGMGGGTGLYFANSPEGPDAAGRRRRLEKRLSMDILGLTAEGAVALTSS